MTRELREVAQLLVDEYNWSALDVVLRPEDDGFLEAFMRHAGLADEEEA